MKLNKETLKKIIELVEFDNQYINFIKELELLEKEKEALNFEIKNILENNTDKKFKESDSEKSLKYTELNLKDLEESLKQKTEKLNSVKNNKEFISINKEINEIEDKIYFQEQKLIDETNKYKSIKTDLTATEKENNESIVKINSNIQNIEIKLETINLNIESYKSKRLEKTIDLPADFFKLYDTIKFKTTNPLSKLVNDYCSECFFIINIKDVQLLKKNTLLNCKNCYRLLYAEENDIKAEPIIIKKKKQTV